ncbi:MAG: hypothetical protein ACQEVA_13560 [Myxococcota bacterium]
MGPVDTLWRWLAGSRDAVARRAEELGLAGAARVAARTLGEELSDDELHDWQLETLSAFLDRLVHDPDGELPTASEVGAAETCATFISRLPAARIAQISHVLAVFEAGAVVLPGAHARKRFTRLDPPDQDAYLSGWATSDLPQRRTIFAALKSIGGIGYWSRDATWAPIGYSIEDNPGVPDHAKSGGSS